MNTTYKGSVNVETSFKIFLSNLYYKLECNDFSFRDILTNPKSDIVYLEYNRFTGQVKVDARVIENRLRDYKKGLSYQDMNRLYKQFLTVNNSEQHY